MLYKAKMPSLRERILEQEAEQEIAEVKEVKEVKKEVKERKAKVKGRSKQK